MIYILKMHSLELIVGGVGTVAKVRDLEFSHANLSTSAHNI